MNKIYQLKVSKIQKETALSVSVSFDIPVELKEVFKYNAGQYLTLQFQINGENVRRSYSLCSSPKEEILKIGVKRVQDGLVSNFINDKVKVGDVIEVLPPGGKFYAAIEKENYKTYYLFCAGSGITPVLSILKTVLKTEKRSFVYMLYGNKNKDNIMFFEELEKLKSDFEDRFVIVHTLSSAKWNWKDLFKSQNEDDYRKGRVDKENIEWFINQYPPKAQNAEYYICGPGNMIDNTINVLKKIDVPEERIFSENFGGKLINAQIDGVENSNLIAHLNGDKIQLNISKGKTILRTLINSGYNPPYSCEGGVCSTCKCKIVKGKVHMKNNLGLDEDEVKKGYVLSCQSIALTDDIEVRY